MDDAGVVVSVSPANVLLPRAWGCVSCNEVRFKQRFGRWGRRKSRARSVPLEGGREELEMDQWGGWLLTLTASGKVEFMFGDPSYEDFKMNPAKYGEVRAFVISITEKRC